MYPVERLHVSSGALDMYPVEHLPGMRIGVTRWCAASLWPDEKRDALIARRATFPSARKSARIDQSHVPEGVDAARRCLNAADIQDILDKVTSARYVPPPDLDQLELLRDLNNAWEFRKLRKQAVSKASRTIIRKYAEKVAKTANALSEIGAAVPLTDLQIRLQHLRESAVAVLGQFVQFPVCEMAVDLKRLNRPAPASTEDCFGSIQSHRF
jgi:hypothetical protein